jgi:hypothetical protein
MVEGVNDLNTISVLTGEMTGRCRETDCAKTGLPPDSIPAQRIPDDSISLSGQQAEPLIYSKPAKNEQCQACAFPVLRKLVARILQDQHTASRIDNGELEAIVIDKITPENAKALVANDGHWQPDQTASRIISFALTISGNNPKKLDKIKESIISGFQLAGESFGGELPEISGRTFTAAMNNLDEWSGKPDDTRSK